MALTIKRWLAAGCLACVLVIASACAGQTSPAQVEPVSGEVLEDLDASMRVLEPGTAVQPKLEGFEPALENEFLRLYMNRGTAEIAVYDKRSGDVWYSNPQDRAQDAKASPYLKGKLGAQISFTYLTGNGQNKEYDSFNDSVQHQQYTMEVSETGLLVTYQFGNPQKGLESIPEKVQDERFRELIGRLEEEKDRDELQEKRYKLNEETGVWERRDIPKALVEKIVGIFAKLGYTPEDLALDNEQNGLASGAVAQNPKFTVALRYRLDGEHLVASLDTREMVEETKPYRIHMISLLESFGAAGKEEEGYIFVPDGSGAIIDLNQSNAGAASPIMLSMYGDNASMFLREKFNQLVPSRLPVYGMKRGPSAFLAIMEHGEALARLTADISKRLYDYQVVSNQFVILPKDEVRLSQNEYLYKTPNAKYNGMLQLRIAFLHGGEANYSGMAESYRSYLTEKYGWERTEARKNVPLYIELTGSIPEKRNLLGFPYETLAPLSRVEQADLLVDRLGKDQVSDVRMIYKGWFNEGLDHRFPNDVKMDSVIGSKEEWNELADKLEHSGGALYPDVAFLQVYHEGNGFKPREDAAQFISRQYARVFEFDLAASFKHYGRLDYYVLSPSALGPTVDGFLDDYEVYNPGAISLRDLGNEVHSDFKKGREYTREDAKRLVEQQLEKLHEAAPDLLVGGGNAYALRYAEHVVDAPLTSNQFQAARSVPYYQMVLHGYIDYAGEPFNLAEEQDASVHILRSLETGASVYYSWILEDPSVLKKSRFSYMYSSDVENWYDEAIQTYKEINAVLGTVQGQTIQKHEQLMKGVYRTVYESGVTIIVNYNDYPVTAEGLTIEAEDYEVRGG